MGHKLSRLWRQRSERKAHCVTSDQNGHLPTSVHELNPPPEAGASKNNMQSDDSTGPLQAYDDPYAADPWCRHAVCGDEVELTEGTGMEAGGS